MGQERVVTGLATLLTLAGVATGPSVWAHDGAGAAFDGSAGPFRVLGYDGRTVPASATEYAVILSDSVSGAPVDDAAVTVTAEAVGDRGASSSRVGPVVADRVANVYRYALPNGRGSGWDVELRIVAPVARTQVSFQVHAEPASPPTEVLAEGPGFLRLMFVGLLGALGAAVLMRPFLRWRLKVAGASRA